MIDKEQEKKDTIEYVGSVKQMEDILDDLDEESLEGIKEEHKKLTDADPYWKVRYYQSDTEGRMKTGWDQIVYMHLIGLRKDTWITELKHRIYQEGEVSHGKIDIRDSPRPLLNEQDYADALEQTKKAAEFVER